MGPPANRRREIYRALASSLDRSDELLVIHTSLIHLRSEAAGLKWDLLAALSALLLDGKTLALPTFTFSFCRGQPFDIRRSHSEAGQLGEWFLELSSAVRTPHPIYSFAVAGPFADEITACANSTTFGDDSVFGLFERRNARIVLLGADWDVCTQFHRYEEEAQVPYRFYKTFTGTADYGAGPQPAAARMFVRNLEIDPINDFSPAADRLIRAGKVTRTPLLGGLVQSARCQDIAAACRDALAQDPLAFVKQRPIVEHRLRGRAGPRTPTKIAVVGGRNLQLLHTALAEIAPAHLPDREVAVYSVPFGQVFQEVLSPSSGLRRFAADFTFFVDRIEDIFQTDTLEELGERENADEVFARHLEMIRTYRDGARGEIFVNTFINAHAPILGLADGTARNGTESLVAKLNRRLEEGLATSSGPPVHIVNLAQAGLLFGEGPIFDPRIWYLGRFPFSHAFTRYLARRYCGMMLAALGRTARLIVVDLDDTLWGGVLGEDGISGLRIGGDYPGNAFLALQQTLKGLSQRGIALAVCSKNDEAYALQAMRELPQMVLREGDLAASRINWRPKWTNVEEIASELNLGLEHVLFVDDSPAERAEMRHHLPAVRVLDLPEDPAQYAAALLASPYLECLSVTREDLTRARGYQARRDVERSRSRYERVEDFYASLGSTLHVFPLDPGNIARAEQLVNKTNQFNATTRRYTRAELETMNTAGASVFVLGLEDRFSPLENIGVLIVRWHRPEPTWAEIDSFLLSCRVLGRGVETAILSWLRKKAAGRGMTSLVGRIIPTERNTPVRSVYTDHGFAQGAAEGEWRIDLNQGREDTPSWMTIIDHAAERDRRDASIR